MPRPRVIVEIQSSYNLAKLPPVTLVKHVSTPLMHPAMFHPAGVRVRGTIPPTWNPHIAASIVAMVTANPHKSSPWRRRTTFHNRSGRTDPNHNLRKSSRHQSHSKQQGKNKFFHESYILLF